MATDIRPANAGNLDTVRRIARAAYALYVERIGREPAPMVADFAASITAGQVWVSGDPVAGFLVGYPRGDHWHLENVAVDPAVQGAGLGRGLMAFAVTQARAAGAQSVELYTHDKMTENQKLYPQLGYAEVGRGSRMGSTGCSIASHWLFEFGP